MKRPDRAGYVIDIMPDFITYQEHVTGKTHRLPVFQVWVDPRRPDSHRDPVFRAWALRRAAEGAAVLLRYGSRDGKILFAPTLTNAGDWVEWDSCMTESEHSIADIMVDNGR
jgi:hypothetical protein